MPVGSRARKCAILWVVEPISCWAYILTTTPLYTVMAADLCPSSQVVDGLYTYITYILTPQEEAPTSTAPAQAQACSSHWPSKDTGTVLLHPTLHSPSNYTELSSYKSWHSISPALLINLSLAFSHNTASDINFNPHPSNPLRNKFGSASWLCCATKL